MSGRQSGRWRIESITVTGFRGVRASQEIRFDGLPVLVWGGNGVGKSTIALALEWILFGGFPSGAFGKRCEAALSPVGGARRSSAGEVVFVRGGERLVVRRDAGQDAFEGAFTVTCGSRRGAGEKGARLLEELLGLDQDTFVRAVLLQQRNVRGLLLDEPKERNKALDRLLGMDSAELLLERVKPRPFKDAAGAWRRRIRDVEDRFASQHEVLAGQYEAAERHARERRFLGKDLSDAGLEARYEELDRDLLRTAARHGAEVSPLPAAASPALARKASGALARALGEIRRGAELSRRLAPIEKKIAAVAAARERWNEALEGRKAAEERVAGIVAKHGDAKAIAARIAGLESDVRDEEASLRAADELRALLLQARDYLRGRPLESCPVCEQGVSGPEPLRRSLAARIDALATRQAKDLEAAVAKARAALAAETEAAKALEAESREVERRNAEVEAERKRCMAAVGAASLLEKKVGTELDAAETELLRERKELRNGIDTMERELEALADRDRAIGEALLPFLEARESLRRHEARWKQARAGYAAMEKKAGELDLLATQVESIRDALIAAKDEIASDTLGKAAPRAQELYAELVRHRLFDRLEVKTARRANKVDYAFEVSVSKDSKSAREARLVLSDGQLTAAALALFFALAETGRHALDVLYVDDPTQNLDHARKEAMARVVAGVAERRQVVVSTQDEDFVTLLRDAGFDRRGVVHHIEDWDGSPAVEMRLPPSAA